MTITTKLRALGLTALATLGTSAAFAGELSPDQVARLDTDLTPMGGIRAGNEAGTIPAWEGGIKSAADAGFPDFKSGGHHPDPFPDDPVLYTVNAANMAQYADILSEGNKALLQAYPDTYFMNVYQTRRSAAYPQRIYDATKRIASTASLIDGGNGVVGHRGRAVPDPRERS